MHASCSPDIVERTEEEKSFFVFLLNGAWGLEVFSLAVTHLSDDGLVPDNSF